MGGQTGDCGSVQIGEKSLEIVNVIKDSGGRFLHEIKGKINAEDFAGQAIALSVNLERRLAIQRHHSATHILHWALREVLGDHVRQAGSLVEEDRLRFDFSHYQSPSTDELKTIELLANEKLLLNEPVETYEIPFSEKPDGVIAFFGDKYGDIVRVVDMGGWSQELCGGTHVRTGGEIGSIRLVSESAISAGTRRIEAVAGLSAYRWADERLNEYNKLLDLFSCRPQELPAKIQLIQSKTKELEKTIKAFEQKGQAGIADDLIKRAKDNDGIKIVAQVVAKLSPNDLRALAAQVGKRTSPSVVLLASEDSSKCSFVCICSEEAVSAGHNAGGYIEELAAKLGGKGGGKPDFAMGGSLAGKGLESSFSSHSLLV